MPVYSSFTFCSAVIVGSASTIYHPALKFSPFVNNNVPTGKMYVCKECNLTTTDNLCECLNCGNIFYIEI